MIRSRNTQLTMSPRKVASKGRERSQKVETGCTAVHLTTQIAMVGQEPVLYATTVHANIAYGIRSNRDNSGECGSGGSVRVDGGT